MNSGAVSSTWMNRRTSSYRPASTIVVRSRDSRLPRSRSATLVCRSSTRAESAASRFRYGEENGARAREIGRKHLGVELLEPVPGA